MKLTAKILEDLFVKCNKDFFNSELVKPKFGTYIGNNTMGIFSVITSKKTNKQTLKISIAKNFELTEDELRDILVHEMIHEYVFLKKGVNEGHKKMFVEKMNELNEKYGLDIRKNSKHIYKKQKNASFFKKIINALF